MTDKQSQRGFALAATIFALVALGVLATGGFYFARQEAWATVIARTSRTGGSHSIPGLHVETTSPLFM